LAALEHPNIATMLDAGVGPNGRPYFAMELVRGGTITRWCREHDATLEERLRMFIQVCQAVHHAHEKGILHRDIKPTNVLVTEVDGAPVPKVIDFGIAKAMHSGSLDDLTMLTQEEQVIGTPVYMSPEQIEGGRRLDTRSDVYALGALLYEMLTGAQPFDVTSVSKGGLAAVRELVLETNPERPSTRLPQKTGGRNKPVGQLAGDLSALPADLDWITMKALEKDRLRRYQTAADFAADVQRHLDDLPVLARPPSLTYKAGRWLRRHRRAVALASLGAAASGVIAATVAYHQAEEAKKPRPIVLDDKRVFTNDLGMKFVDVPGTDVLMCIHETRHKDFEAYAKEVPGAIAIWSNGVERGLDPMVEDRGNHPVIRVNWEESQSFCAWLSKKERRVYRLPTDREWSHAVGIGEEEKWTKETTPATVFRHPTAFPWGSEWPPPDGVGNFSDETRMEFAPADGPYFEGRTDGYFTTAPVMRFKPNQLGIYDLSGNVNEWVEDWWDARRKSHALRGGSWSDAKKDNLLSSWRIDGGPAPAHPAFGFRCVVERRPAFHADPTPPPVEKPKPPRFPPDMTPDALAKADITNSLGMKLVPIPGTDVLFCIHETRRQDYLAFNKEVPQTGSALQWKEQQWAGVPTGMEDGHPVSGVNWHDAQAFCDWLSQKEGKKYRLPTDREWSIAVGLGALERLTRDTTPEMLGGIGPGSFPYGGRFPPTTEKRPGNYADQAHRRAFPTVDILEKYDDGFATSSPVMSFPPNPLGLYDMGGNVREWVDDWLNARRAHRILRGGSWEDFTVDGLRSSKRHPSLPEIHRASHGFRIALESALPDPNLPPPTKFPDPLPPAEVKARSITNSLGMTFTPVPGTDVLFCIHETRRQDFAAYARLYEKTPGFGLAWKLQHRAGRPAGAEDDHPVVAVSWQHAQGFCDWLSRKENRLYRLPTDREWSIAVGLGEVEAENGTPEMLDRAGRTEFPWGQTFPPLSEWRAGNYADRTFVSVFPRMPSVPGYTDGFATTAPVMSFKPNPFGLYDMGGNVGEWCEDWLNDQTGKVLRGSGWADDNANVLFSAKRRSLTPGTCNLQFGFRCVLVPDSAPPGPSEQQAQPSEAAAPAQLIHPAAISRLQAHQQPIFPSSLSPADALSQAQTNSLGMKLVPVPGTSVLFCIHETRNQDYAAFAAENPATNADWLATPSQNAASKESSGSHPVAKVSWLDAQSFCAWLSQKEGRAYRLPTDREWSLAVGIGHLEDWDEHTTPQTVFKPQGIYPWEGGWPPLQSVANFSDETRRRQAPDPAAKYVTGYDDGQAFTAPVMSYPPNKLGLHDMGGNVAEWCEDAFDNERYDFPTRGGSWNTADGNYSQASFRLPLRYHFRGAFFGFRIVLEQIQMSEKAKP
jgi:formylglycine-generating enzyme required for sulfatase activity